MQADERKDLETNSLAQSLGSLKGKIDGRTIYFILGSIALIVAGILLFWYFNKQKTQARDATVLALEFADDADKLKKLADEQRGTIFGSIAKLHMARRALTTEGLEKIGTDKAEDRRKAAASLEQARTYFAELTKEFKEKDEPALLQEAWLGLAQAEEALVGLPTNEGGSDSRGDADKAIEAFAKAGAIFPDLELSKSYAVRSKELADNKSQFIEAQKAIYAPAPAPKKETPATKQPENVTPIIKDSVTPPVKVQEPMVPPVGKIPDPAPTKSPEPEPKKAQPEAKKTEPEPKKVEPPKTK